MPKPHTDILSGDWIDRFLPVRFRPFARLMRLDRPIGSWLLLLPCWWSLALASEEGISLWFMFLFVVGAVVMRGAGCAINDMWDRELDKTVERTKTRPIASGALALQSALIFTAFLLLIGFILLLQFNTLTIWLGVSSLILVVLYPLAKRVTWFPQFVLGLAFNWGALLGWAAVRGELALPAFLLYVAGIFWTLAYDTIYAHQDTSGDRLFGVKSLALRLGDKSQLWIAGFFDLCFLSLILAGWFAGLHVGFYVGLCVAFLHALWQLLSWHQKEPSSSLEKFRSNRDFGLIILAAILMGKIF